MSDLLARLIAAGTPADLVAEVALELARAQAAQEAIETRRANDRERSARRHVKSRDITGYNVTTRDVTGEPLPSPSPSFPPDPQTNPTPAHPRDGDTPRTRKADDFPKPEWADPQVWADFMANRKAKKARNTVTAYRGFLSDIEKHASPDWPPGRLLEHATAKGWAAIYDPEKDDRNGTRTRQPAVQQTADGLRGPRPDPAFDLLMQARAEIEAGSSEGEGGGGETWAALPSYLRN